MRIENDFTVPAPPEQAWDFLLDVPRVAPCMPGAEITETVDERTWKGKVSVKLGPVSLAFAGTLVLDEADEEGRRVVMKANGQDTRGKGAVSATMTSSLEPDGDGTRVSVVTDLTISGPAAQYGRGMIGDVSQRFTQEFAECVAGRIGGDGRAVEAGAAEGTAGTAPEGEAAGVEGARPISGVRLGLWAASRAVRRFFRRLFGRGEATG